MPCTLKIRFDGSLAFYHLFCDWHWWQPSFSHTSKGDCLLPFLEHQIAHWGLLRVLRKLRHNQTCHWESLSLAGSKPHSPGHVHTSYAGHLAGKIFSFSLVRVHRLIRICKNLCLHCQIRRQMSRGSFVFVYHQRFKIFSWSSIKILTEIRPFETPLFKSKCLRGRRTFPYCHDWTHTWHTVESVIVGSIWQNQLYIL